MNFGTHDRSVILNTLSEASRVFGTLPAESLGMKRSSVMKWVKQTDQPCECYFADHEDMKLVISKYPEEPGRYDWELYIGENDSSGQGGAVKARNLTSAIRQVEELAFALRANRFKN